MKGIIDDVVAQTFSFLVELKHKLCQELLEEALEAVVMGPLELCGSEGWQSSLQRTSLQ